MLLNGGSSNSVCKKWIKEVFWLCAIYNINLVPKYINTKANLVADTLSRLPYFNDLLKVEECLLGSNLCCLKEIFEIFRLKNQRVRRESQDSQDELCFNEYPKI